MKRVIIAASLVALLGVSAAQAQPRPHDDNDRRAEQRDRQHWQRGQHLPKAQRGARVDHKRFHLQTPKRDQQWVKVDSDYVLINIATGIIASVVAAGR